MLSPGNTSLIRPLSTNITVAVPLIFQIRSLRRFFLKLFNTVFFPSTLLLNFCFRIFL